MSTFDNTNPYNSTLYNKTELTESDKQWERIENELIDNRQAPYDKLNASDSFGIAFFGQDNVHSLFAKRKEDRIKRQQDYYAKLAAGTMNQVEFQQDTKPNTENLAAFKRLEQLKRRNPSSIPDEIIEQGESFDETKPINYYVELENELYRRGFKGGKSRKSKKSKKSKKSNKANKSKKSNKSRKSKK